MSERSEAKAQDAVHDAAPAYRPLPADATRDDVPSGYKRTEVGVIPQEWEVRTFRDLSMMKSGESITSATIDESSPYPCYGGNGLRGFTSRYTHDGEHVLIGRQGALCGNVMRARGRFYASEHAVVTTAKTGVDTDWLSYVLETMQLNRLSESSAQPGLSVKKVLSLQTAVPAYEEEQRAIATALSDVDAQIESLDRLIAKKRAIKQAVMQQLLTGQTRLPGFTGGWETKKLGEFVSIRNQKVMPPSVHPETPCIELEHIGQGDGRLLTHSTAKYSTASKYQFRTGDVLFGRLRSYLRKYWLAKQDGICTTEIWPLAIDADKAVSGFLLGIVQSDRFAEAASISYGTHMPRADWKVLKNFEVRLPKVEEQTAIATALTDMDAEIETLERRRDKARQIKQGMMQQLLTGRVRLIAPEKVA